MTVDREQVRPRPSVFALNNKELRSVLLAYDELLSYWETIGQESSLDDEEMPDPRIPDALATLRFVLTRVGLLP